MNQNEQIMLAALRACATTVEELVATVAALPARLESRMQEVQQGVATALSTHAEGTAKAMGVCEALRADMADLSAGFTARLDAIAQASEQRTAEQAQIIADNQGAITALRADLAAAAQATGAICEELGAGATALAERVADHSNNLFNLNALVPKVKTELAEQIASVQTTVEAAQARLADADVELARVTQANMDAIVADIANVKGANSDTFKAVAEVGDQLNKTATDFSEQISHVRTIVSGQIDRSEEQTRQYVELELAKTGNHVQELKGSVQGLSVSVESILNFNAGQAGELQKHIETTSAAFMAMQDKTEADFTHFNTELTKGLREVRAEVTEARGESAQMLESVVATLNATKEALGHRVGELEEAVPGLAETVEGHGASIDAFYGMYKKLNMPLEGTLATVDDVVKAVDTVNQSVAQHFENTTQQIVNVAEEAKALVVPLQDEVKTLAEDVGVIRMSVDGRFDAVLKIVDENDKNQTQMLEDTVRVTHDAVKATTEEVGRVAEKVDNLHKHVVEEVGSLNKSIKEGDDALRKDVDAVTTEDRKTANTLYSAAIDNTEELRKTVEALRDTTEQGFADAATKRGIDVQELREDIDQLRKGTVADLTSISEKTTAVALNLDAFMEGIDERFSEFQAKHAGLADENKELALAVGALRDTTKADIKTSIDKLLKAMEEVPVGLSPEDLAELQVRNAAAVDAQIGTALAGMRVETEYTDGVVNIVAVLPRHDGTESRSTVSVPVDIGVRYRQVWLENESYRPGDMVSHKGSVWVAKTNTAGEPGNDITGWTLAVKRGNHGRDGYSTKFYETHEENRLYREGDFLHWGNRLWQAKKEGRIAPDTAATSSTEAWALIGSLQ